MSQITNPNMKGLNTYKWGYDIWGTRCIHNYNRKAKRWWNVKIRKMKHKDLVYIKQ